MSEQIMEAVNGAAVQLITVALGLAATWAGAQLAAMFKAKAKTAKLEGDRVQVALWNVLAEQAVQAAEEWRADMAKTATPGDWVPDGPAMLDQAIKLLISRIPGMTAVVAEPLIKAALARIPGAGATGKAAFTSQPFRPAKGA